MKYSLSLLSAAVVALGLAGCSTPKVVDNTPLADTSVVKAKYIIGGYILPDSQGEQVTYTLADRRTIENTVEFDSWISRQIFGETHEADIARLDKNLQWQVDHTRKNYVECPLKGCTDLSIWEQLENGETSEEEEVYDPSGGDACQMTTSEFSFSVTPKDKDRVVNGFTADQFVAQWKMVSQDEQGHEDKHVMTMDFWMTQADPAMQDVWGINGQFQDNYLKAVADANNPLSKFFTDSVYKVVAMISGDIEKQELDSDSEVLKGLSQLEGYPVSIKLEWFADNQACQQQKQAASGSGGFDVSDPVGSLGKLAGNMLQTAAEDKAKDYMGYGKDKPVFTYIYDVTSAQVQPERASRFEVPANYKLENRR
ncbi:hypothetical protein KUV59_13080 [Marinobacter daepoensis]|uniref:hypothetical protein n=1 Tax=Marinobacter daepoensis TaxID=262077 RepID=UPI001C98C2DE|nr:hypothetical protein [Marinobacter daepoensis]